MTEQTGNDRYINCSACKCKYINDNEHIRTDFGYNRLQERYKTCIKCRDTRKQYNKDNPGQTKARRDTLLTQEVDDNHQVCTKCLNTKHVDDIIENKKQFKYCTSCRNKPKQQLMAIKEALAGGSTKRCKICQADKQVNQFQRKRETNLLVSTCNPCRKMLFEKFTIERQKRLASLAQGTNNDDDK